MRRSVPFMFYKFPVATKAPEGVQGDDRKAPWSPPLRRNLLRNRKKNVKLFPLPPTRNPFLVVPIRFNRWTPKVSKGRSESPLVASAEAKLSMKQEKARRTLSLPPIRNLFLVGGFARLRAGEVLSIIGKYPKAAGGVQRVHATWPPPDPPLLRNSSPLASQGRAQLALHPSLGGPLSPSAQLIPPPAFGRRFIPGVVARSRHCRKTLRRYVPRLRCQAKCGSAAVSDW